MKKKNMDYFDAQRKYNLKPFGDVDRDGVKNVMDCKPYDSNRDGILGRVAHAVTGGRYGQSAEEYELEKRNKPLMREERRVERRRDRIEWKQQREKAYKEEYRKARLERIKKNAREAGSTSIADRFNKAADKIQIKPYSTKNNYNPWGSMFDMGMSRPPTKKTKKKKSSTGFGGFDMLDNWGYMK